MIDYVYGHDAVVAHFVAQLIPSCRVRGFPAASKAIGIIRDDKLIAGIVYHNYEPETGQIEMSGAALPGSRWLTRETLKRMYEYPYLELGCQQTVMRVARDNQPLLWILSRYGYKFVHFPRMLGREKDGVICLLTAEDWAANRFNKRPDRQPMDPAPLAAE